MSESVMLAVMTCEKCQPALLQHWKYFLNQRADWNFIVATEKQKGPGVFPPSDGVLFVGPDSYIQGPVLPIRMCDTISALLDFPWGILVLCEYDTVIFKRLPVEKMEHAIAAHLAGYQTWGSKAKTFYHNPYVFMREAAIKFVEAGRKVIADGICAENTPESSPDVFFGYVVQENDMPVQADLWLEYSRNDLSNQQDLASAKLAYLRGYHCVHGVKTKEQLDYIL